MEYEEFYKKQVSLSEWFEFSGYINTEKFRSEDNEKRERLKTLNQIIGLPFDQPTQFLATELANKSKSFLDFLEKKGQELCAIRLIPLDPKLPKLRLRGKNVIEAVEWFYKQNIEATSYKVDFIPHTEDSFWSTVFIVNKHGIFGEIIKDKHLHLTQGFYEKVLPVLFHYDFKNWNFNADDKDTLDHLKIIAKALEVSVCKKRKQIKKIFGSKFHHNYLEGYFETVYSVDFGLWFIDYNRILGHMYSDFVPKIKLNSKKQMTILKGYPASTGKVKGIVKIVRAENIEDVKLSDNKTILVCDVTTPDFVPIMKKCLAIITDRGGILSHAAIVSRELNLPCIVATHNATSVLKDGMWVMVDGDNGTVEVISNNF